MSRPGYTNALRAILEGQPALARPIAEVLEIVSGDVINTDAEFNGADSLVGFEVIAGAGGVQLAPVAGFLVDNVTGFVATAGNAIDLDNQPQQTPDLNTMAIVEWSTADANKPVFAGQAHITNPGGGTSPQYITAQLFRLDTIDNTNPIDAKWTLVALTAPIDQNEAQPPATGVVSFTFSTFGGILTGGAPTVIGTPNQQPQFDTTKNIMVMWVWGTRSQGSPATAGDWNADNTIGVLPDPGGSNQNLMGWNSLYTAPVWDPALNLRLGTPGFALLGSTFAEATITWSTNFLDLGQAPLADTDLAMVLITNTAGGTSVLAEVAAAGSGNWFEFTDTDVIGEDRTSEGGNDLSSVPRQQTYDVRATLTPSTDSATSPVLYRIGILEADSTIVDAEIDVESYDVACDPIGCQSEVPTASIRIRRDGVKDYRSFGEELFSDNPFASIQVKLWLGHPSIPQADWLNIDTFNIRNMDPSTDGLAIDLAGHLLGVLEAFPPAGSRQAPDLYTFIATTVAGAWDEIHGLLDIPGDQIGNGPQGPNTIYTAPVGIIARILTEVEPAIDLRIQLDFLAGGVTISRQGAFEFRSLFDTTPPDPSLAIGLRDYEVTGWDLGTDRRTTTVDIAYPDPASADRLEKTYSAPEEVLAAYGTFGGGEPNVIGGDETKWFPDAVGNDEIPDILGARLVTFFGVGIQQIRVKCRTPRPHIELGDVLTLDQDRLLEFNPFTQGPVRGRLPVTCRVTGIHNIFGTDLTLWLQPTSFSRGLAQVEGTGRGGTTTTAVVTYSGEDFRPRRWAAEYAAETGAGGNIQKVLARWDRFSGRLECESNLDGLAPQCVLPVPLAEDVEIRAVFMAASIPVGTLDVEFVRYPIDGSPREVIETFTFTNTVGRDLQLIDVIPNHIVDVDSTYNVEASCPLLDDGDTFEIFAFALLITEIIQQ